MCTCVKNKGTFNSAPCFESLTKQVVGWLAFMVCTESTWAGMQRKIAHGDKSTDDRVDFVWVGPAMAWSH